MFGFILGEILDVVETIARNHHAWTGDLSQEEALNKLRGIREKLTVTADAEESGNDHA